MLIVSRKEDYKYILLLLPLAILPDLDTFATQHRALLHNIFIPVILLFMASVVKKARMIFIISAVYIGSHVLLDMFGGGVVLFYPVYNSIAFVDASLRISQTNELSWTMNYGFSDYSEAWKTAYGYISDSIGIGSMLFVFLAGVCAAYQNKEARERK